MPQSINEIKLVEQVAVDLSLFQQPRFMSVSLPDIWIAKSLVQKAIRRNDVVQALRATAFAIETDAKSFWRRLPIIAWEDVGLANIDLCNSVIALARSKRLRTKLGGEMKVASYLVTSLCCASKDRSSDDLLTVIEHDHSLKADQEGIYAIRKKFIYDNQRVIADAGILKAATNIECQVLTPASFPTNLTTFMEIVSHSVNRDRQ